MRPATEYRHLLLGKWLKSWYEVTELYIVLSVQDCHGKQWCQTLVDGPAAASRILPVIYVGHDEAIYDIDCQSAPKLLEHVIASLPKHLLVAVQEHGQCTTNAKNGTCNPA